MTSQEYLNIAPGHGLAGLVYQLVTALKQSHEFAEEQARRREAARLHHIAMCNRKIRCMMEEQCNLPTPIRSL